MTETDFHLFESIRPEFESGDEGFLERFTDSLNVTEPIISCTILPLHPSDHRPDGPLIHLLFGLEKAISYQSIQLIRTFHSLRKMTIKITCPHCTQRIEAPGEVIGTIVDCPICSGEIHVGRRHVSHEFFSGVGGLNFCCIHCQQALAISEIFAGNNATCPVCNKQMQIPERSTPNLGVYHYSPGERWKPESILRHLEPFASKAKRIYVKPDIPEWPLRYVSKCCQLPNASVIGMMVSSASLPGSESVVFSDTSLFIIRGSEPTRLDYHHAFSLPISTTSAERIDLGDIGFSILDGQGDSFIRLFCKLAASYPGKLRPIVTEPPKNRKPSAREVREEAERECQEAFRNTPDGRNQLIVKISIQSTLGTKSICGPSEMANAGGDAYCRVLKKYGITYSWSDRLD